MGNAKRIAAARMPRLIYTKEAREDFIRAYQFLLTKNAVAAGKAKQAILDTINRLPAMPMAHRPVSLHPHQRDLMIPFGSSGYIVRYRYEHGGDIIILRMWHQREAGFENV